MTFEQLYTLQDVVREALDKTNSGPTRDVIRWLQLNRRAVLDQNQMTIEVEGLGNIVRAERKKGANRESAPEIHSLCLDFGIETLDLPDEISVPTDMDNLLYCHCEWEPLDDATIDDLDKHVLLLQAQISANVASVDSISILRQAAIRVVPGRTDIPLRELRRIARGGNAHGVD